MGKIDVDRDVGQGYNEQDPFYFRGPGFGTGGKFSVPIYRKMARPWRHLPAEKMPRYIHNLPEEIQNRRHSSEDTPHIALDENETEKKQKETRVMSEGQRCRGTEIKCGHHRGTLRAFFCAIKSMVPRVRSYGAFCSGAPKRSQSLGPLEARIGIHLE